MQLISVSLLNGVLYGMLLFLLASGLTVILSLMGVLNFAHTSFYMIGAYLAFTISQLVGFWPALIIAPLLVGGIGILVENYGLRRVHAQGHLIELLFTFALAFVIEQMVSMIWGKQPVPYRIPESMSGAAFIMYGAEIQIYRVFMFVLSAVVFVGLFYGLVRTRIGLIVQAALTHPEMVGSLGHNVPRIFMFVFGGGAALAGLAGVIGGNYLSTNPGMALQLGSIVFVVVVLGGLGSLPGAFIASLLVGLIQTMAVSVDVSAADGLRALGLSVHGWWLEELLSLSVARMAPLLPFLLLMLVLIFRPRGLMGTR